MNKDLGLFKVLVCYFYNLKQAGKIDDETLHKLIHFSCSVYLEEQLWYLVEKYIDGISLSDRR